MLLLIVGRMSAIWPQAKNAVEVYDTIKEYAKDIGSPAGVLATQEVFDSRNQAEAAAMQQREEAEVGKTMAQGAELLGKTDGDNLQQNLAAVTGGGIS